MLDESNRLSLSSFQNEKRSARLDSVAECLEESSDPSTHHSTDSTKGFKTPEPNYAELITNGHHGESTVAKQSDPLKTDMSVEKLPHSSGKQTVLNKVASLFKTHNITKGISEEAQPGTKRSESSTGHSQTNAVPFTVKQTEDVADVANFSIPKCKH